MIPIDGGDRNPAKFEKECGTATLVEMALDMTFLPLVCFRDCDSSDGEV